MCVTTADGPCLLWLRLSPGTSLLAWLCYRRRRRISIIKNSKLGCFLFFFLSSGGNRYRLSCTRIGIGRDCIIMVVHHNATSVTMEVDPPQNANSPGDPKTANGSSETEKGEDSESSEDGPPLDVGESYLVRRYDDTWREYKPPPPPQPTFIKTINDGRIPPARARSARPVAGARNVISLRVRKSAHRADANKARSRVCARACVRVSGRARVFVCVRRRRRPCLFTGRECECARTVIIGVVNLGRYMLEEATAVRTDEMLCNLGAGAQHVIILL